MTILSLNFNSYLMTMIFFLKVKTFYLAIQSIFLIIWTLSQDNDTDIS